MALDTAGWSYWDQQLPDEAKQLIAQYKDQWNTAADDVGRTAANNAANAVRQQYGYTGGGSGGAYQAYSPDYDMTGWSAADQQLPEEARKLIAQYKAGWKNSATDIDRQYYNQMANNVREQYGGYTGGTSGGGYAQIPEYEKEYQSAYQDQIQGVLDKINGYGDFSYDYATDPSYQAYADAYARQGQSAAEKGMAISAANTGGVASSYGQAVANQALQQAAKQTADIIPTLEQNAYGRWSDQLGNLQNIAGLYNNLDTSAYSQFSNSRDFDYGQSRDTVSDEQWQRELELALEQFEWQKQMDEVANALSWASLNRSSGGGSGGSSKSSSSKSSGGSSGSKTSSGKSSGGSSSSSTKITPGASLGNGYSQAQLKISALKSMGGASSSAIKTAINNAYNSGLITQEGAKKLWNLYGS